MVILINKDLYPNAGHFPYRGSWLGIQGCFQNTAEQIYWGILLFQSERWGIHKSLLQNLLSSKTHHCLYKGPENHHCCHCLKPLTLYAGIYYTSHVFTISISVAENCTLSKIFAIRPAAGRWFPLDLCLANLNKCV